MAHPVVTLAKAESDIRRIAMRIARTVAPSSAIRWHAGVLTKVRSLALNPEMWPLAEEAEDLGIPLRHVLYGKRRHIYRILYTFDGTTIHVHRVRHAT
ncbi:MAG: type II toxin-antitoxin system RelE/ParE family toxin [Gemmataceae bacterium]